MINHDDLDQLPREDLDLPALEYRGSLRRLLLLVLVWMLLVGMGCALIFRWTNVPPDQQLYSAPLRTRPPSLP